MEFLKNVIGDDLYAQLSQALVGHEKDIKIANLADGGYVSKAKYDKDIATKDASIQQLTDTVKSSEGVDVKGLQSQVKDWEDKYKKDMDQAKIDNAVALAIAKSNTRSEKALRGMLDFDKIKLDSDGKLVGLDEQLAEIKKENDFLFEPVQAPKDDKKKTKDVNLGGNHGGGNPKDASNEDVDIFSAVNEAYE